MRLACTINQAFTPPSMKHTLSEKFALLVVDAQLVECGAGHGGDTETEDIVKRIAGVIPKVRAAGGHVLWCWTVQNPDLAQACFDHDGGGYHPLLKSQIQSGDVVLPKNTLDLFCNPEAAARVHALGARQILVAGFNENACVYHTATGASKLRCRAGSHVNVSVVRDLCGDRPDIRHRVLWDDNCMGEPTSSIVLRTWGIPYVQSHRLF